MTHALATYSDSDRYSLKIITANFLVSTFMLRKQQCHAQSNKEHASSTQVYSSVTLRVTKNTLAQRRCAAVASPGSKGPGSPGFQVKFWIPHCISEAKYALSKLVQCFASPLKNLDRYCTRKQKTGAVLHGKALKPRRIEVGKHTHIHTHIHTLSFQF